MKSILVLYLIVLGASVARSQQNLVWNGGFEQDENGVFLIDEINCNNPEGNSDGRCPSVNTVSSENYQDQLDYWNEVFHWTCPEKKRDFFLCRGVGSADVRCANVSTPRSGLYSGEGHAGEFITQELKTSLDINSTYYVEFYCFSTDVMSDRGFIFSVDPPEQCFGNKLDIASDPDIVFSENTNGEYLKKTLYFKPLSTNLKSLTVGFTDGGTGFYKVDDIRIFEVGDDRCADDDWLLQNTDLYSWIYNAADNIVAGSNVMGDDDAYPGEVVVKNGSYVWFKAGNQVILEPGFSTEDGAYFETIIEPGCAPFDPCNHYSPNDESIYICDSNPIEIGPAFIEEYVEYSWSPTTYLDNPNSPNPICSPPSGQGTIEYTLTMTAFCGAFIDPGFPPTSSSTIDVTYFVEYNSSPDPNPAVSVINFTHSECDASFDVVAGLNTEVIYIDITDQSGQVVYSEQYDIGSIGCCNLAWSSSSLPESFWQDYQSCNDYTIRVRSSNYCFPNTLAEEQLIWNNGGSYQLNTPLGNIITPNGDGNNDWFVLDASGVDKYSLEIKDHHTGITVYEINNVEFCSNSQSGKLWAGQCNKPFCGGDGCVNQGYYNYVLNVFPCGGGMIDYVGTIYNQSPNGSTTYCENLDQKSDETQDGKVLEENQDSDISFSATADFDNPITVFPNPSNGSFQVSFSSGFVDSVIAVELYDALGRRVYLVNSGISVELDFTLNLPKGVYLLKVLTFESIISQKLIFK